MYLSDPRDEVKIRVEQLQRAAAGTYRSVGGRRLGRRWPWGSTTRHLGD